MAILITGATGYIDDLVDLYTVALVSAQAGSFNFVDNGEARLSRSPKQSHAD